MFAVPEKRGVVFRTKGPDPQCAFRIPLPHMGARRILPLCGISGHGLPNHTEGRLFYVKTRAYRSQEDYLPLETISM